MAAPGSVLVEGGSECFSVLCVPLNITTESSRVACELEEETLDSCLPYAPFICAPLPLLFSMRLAE